MAFRFRFARLPAPLLRLTDTICPMKCAQRLRGIHTPALPATDPEVTRDWFLAGVGIRTAPGIQVGDVVWSAGAEGDLGTQVARALEISVRSGAASLRGTRGILVEVTVQLLRVKSGERAVKRGALHQVKLGLRALDALSREVLLEPTLLEARLPMVAQGAAAAEKAAVQTHIARSIGGWLGTCSTVGTSPGAPAVHGLAVGSMLASGMALAAAAQGGVPNAT